MWIGAPGEEKSATGLVFGVAVWRKNMPEADCDGVCAARPGQNPYRIL